MTKFLSLVCFAGFLFVSPEGISAQEQEPKLFFRLPWIPLNIPLPAASAPTNSSGGGGPMCSATIFPDGCLMCMAGATTCEATPPPAPCHFATTPPECTPKCHMNFMMGPTPACTA